MYYTVSAISRLKTYTNAKDRTAIGLLKFSVFETTYYYFFDNNCIQTKLPNSRSTQYKTASAISNDEDV